MQTVTTIGYGDLVATSPGGRLIAALVMLAGIGFLTLVTAAITSTFIETVRRRVDGTASDAVSAKLDRIVARLDVIEGDSQASAGATAMILTEAGGAA